MGFGEQDAFEDRGQRVQGLYPWFYLLQVSFRQGGAVPEKQGYHRGQASHYHGGQGGPRQIHTAESRLFHRLRKPI